MRRATRWGDALRRQAGRRVEARRPAPAGSCAGPQPARARGWRARQRRLAESSPPRVRDAATQSSGWAAQSADIVSWFQDRCIRRSTDRQIRVGEDAGRRPERGTGRDHARSLVPGEGFLLKEGQLAALTQAIGRQELVDGRRSLPRPSASAIRRLEPSLASGNPQIVFGGLRWAPDTPKSFLGAFLGL